MTMYVVKGWGSAAQDMVRIDGTDPAANANGQADDFDPEAAQDWADSAEAELWHHPRNAVRYFRAAAEVMRRHGIPVAIGHEPLVSAQSNTIPASAQVPYPGGDAALATTRGLLDLLRWNAFMTVAGANDREHGLGGHLGTFASNAEIMTLLFLHFFRGKDDSRGSDHLWIQGHDVPGLYVIAHQLGLITTEELLRFRREVAATDALGNIVIDFNERKGLPSYPHADGRPDLFEHHSVVMGLAGMGSIYQARVDRWLANVGLQDTSGSRSWVLLGDSSMREPEHQADLEEAAKDKTPVRHLLNCNLQGLDGVVDGDGNGNIMLKLEARYRAAGWRVIKLILDSSWDGLLAQDVQGMIAARLAEIPDGEWHNMQVQDGAYRREHFFGRRGLPGQEEPHPELRKLVEHFSDDELKKLGWGGHDLLKVYNALKEADETNGPVAVFFRTVKGQGMGRYEAAMGVHSIKELSARPVPNPDPEKPVQVTDLVAIRNILRAPFQDQELAGSFPFWLPEGSDPKIRYLRQQRAQLGGAVPRRVVVEPPALQIPAEIFRIYDEGKDRELISTRVFLDIWTRLIRHPELGRLFPLAVADELKTFGGEGLAAQVAYFNSRGQRYTPADARYKGTRYREAVDGRIFQAGISEAGLMGIWTALGTAYATHGVPICSALMCYSQFLFPHVGSWIYGAGDVRARGFLIGATAGRTTLNGEGTQHQDGSSPLIAHTHPRVSTYDLGPAYEIGAVLQHGVERMFGSGDRDDVMPYLLVYNEKWPVPARPSHVTDEMILGGLYCFKPAEEKLADRPQVQLVASGPMFFEAMRAQEILAGDYQVAAGLWSATSFSELAREADAVRRDDILHVAEAPTPSRVQRLLGPTQGPIVMATDYVRAYPGLVAGELGGRALLLGTDGYGRSDTRAALRRFYGVDAETQVVTALYGLCRGGQIPRQTVLAARQRFGINPAAPYPAAMLPTRLAVR